MTRHPSVPFAVALLVVLAGCAGVSFDVDSSPPTGTPDLSPEGTRGDPSTSAPSPTSAPASGLTATSVPPERRVWSSPVVLAVDPPNGTAADADDRPRDDSRAYAALVREAADYWSTNAERYAGYPVEFVVRPNASDPDVVVRFVDGVPDCGGVTHAAGCAPLITDSRQIQRPESVWVRTGLSDESTALVVKHEVGHLLGLRHDDPPHDVMRSRSVLYTQPMPNATERSFPWRDSAFTVYVDDANASDPAGAREQVDHAVRYYERGAPGMLDNLTFRVVDDPAAADVTVRFDREATCGRSSGSCVRTRGVDPDGDGAIETYTRLDVVLVDLDTEAVGWHVGYWLAFGLGAEDDAEKPPPFRDASRAERRSDWWASNARE